MILIVGAMDIEFRPLLKKLRIVEKISNKKMWLIRAVYKQTEIWLLKTGVGIKNSKKALNWSFDHFAHLNISVGTVIGIGVAGAVRFDLKIGDMMVPKRFLLEDADTVYHADSQLLELCENRFSESMLTVKKVFYKEDKQAITDTSVLSIDMESYVWAEWLNQKEIPFVVIKTISDTLDFVFPKDLRFVNESYTLKDIFLILKKCNIQTIIRLTWFAINWRRAVFKNGNDVITLLNNVLET